MFHEPSVLALAPALYVVQVRHVEYHLHSCHYHVVMFCEHCLSAVKPLALRGP